MFECGYGAVEAALVQAYRIPAKSVGAFRSRLGTLQKQKLFGARNMPGKGVALRYGPDQFHRLVFVCELFEFGIAPSVVLSLVKSLWERPLRKIFSDAEDAVIKHEDAGPDDVILHMGGVHLMVDGWSDAVPNVNSCPLSELPDNMATWMSVKHDDPSGLPPRALVTNLSMRLRAFHAALAASYMDELRAERRTSRATSTGTAKWCITSAVKAASLCGYRGCRAAMNSCSRITRRSAPRRHRPRSSRARFGPRLAASAR
jgi:hypothetical protein